MGKENSMKKIFYGLIFVSLLGACSGPSYFNSPADYVGSRAAAVETHCANKAAAGKDTLVYKLCEESYSTHYGK